jgi:hypothetical protein
MKQDQRQRILRFLGLRRKQFLSRDPVVFSLLAYLKRFIGYIASNGRIIMDDCSERIWKEPAAVWCAVKFQYGSRKIYRSLIWRMSSWNIIYLKSQDKWTEISAEVCLPLDVCANAVTFHNVVINLHWNRRIGVCDYAVCHNTKVSNIT